MPRSIHALLFDLDDTLYSRNAAFRRWAQAFVRDDLGLAEDDPRHPGAIEQIITWDERGYTPRKILFQKIKETYPLTLQDEVGHLIQTYNDRFLDHIRHEEKTLPLLTALREKGLPSEL